MWLSDTTIPGYKERSNIFSGHSFKKYLLTVPSEEGFANCGYIFIEALDIPHPNRERPMTFLGAKGLSF